MIRPIVSLFYTFAQVSLKTVFSSHLCQLAISNSFLVLTGQLVMTSSQSTIFFKWWEFFTTNKWISVYALFQWLKIVIMSQEIRTKFFMLFSWPSRPQWPPQPPLWYL
jgi:hypothetical protein